MAVRFYDEALYNKIQRWIKDPNMRILKPEESTRLFEMEADLNNDETLTLPLIALSRDKNIELLSVEKQPKTFDGFTIIKNINRNINVPLNVIPIKIGYQIDIYTKSLIDADEYVRNFVFNLINYPKLQIEIPYNNVKIIHNSNITIESAVVDNSDIKEHLIADQFCRFTIKLNIDDAYMFSLPEQEAVKLEKLIFEVEDKTSKEIVESEEIK